MGFMMFFLSDILIPFAIAGSAVHLCGAVVGMSTRRVAVGAAVEGGSDTARRVAKITPSCTPLTLRPHLFLC